MFGLNDSQNKNMDQPQAAPVNAQPVPSIPNDPNAQLPDGSTAPEPALVNPNGAIPTPPTLNMPSVAPPPDLSAPSSTPPAPTPVPGGIGDVNLDNAYIATDPPNLATGAAPTSTPPAQPYGSIFGEPRQRGWTYQT